MDDRAALDLIFRAGFSTAAQRHRRQRSRRRHGRRAQTIGKLSGTIEMRSTPGDGTAFVLKLPLTLAIIQVLLVRVAGEDYALPLDIVQRTLAVSPDEVQLRLRPRGARSSTAARSRSSGPPPRSSSAPAAARRLRPTEHGQLVLVDGGGQTLRAGRRAAVGKREIVLKSLGALLDDVPCVAGATLLGERVARHPRRRRDHAARARARPATRAPVAASSRPPPPSVRRKPRSPARRGLATSCASRCAGCSRAPATTSPPRATAPRRSSSPSATPPLRPRVDRRRDAAHGRLRADARACAQQPRHATCRSSW